VRLASYSRAVSVSKGGPVATPPVRPRSLWCDRDFRLLWLGETTSTVGANISRVALPLVAVVTVHASTLQVSALTAAAWLPWLVVGLPTGAWVDRLPRRPVMLLCDVASLILLLSVPLAAWFGVLTYGQLLAVAVLTGASSVFFTTAYSVYVPGLVTGEQVREANAKLQGSEAVAQVAGPGLAGLLAQLAGAVSGLVADALSFLVSAVCLLRIQRAEDVQPTARGTGLHQEIAAGLRLVVGDPYLRVLAVFGALTNLTLVGYQSLLVVFLVREVGVGPATVGALLATTSAGGVLGASVAARLARRVGSARALLLSALGTAPFGLLIPLTAPGLRLALVATGGFVVGCGAVTGNVIKDSWRQVYCPRHLLGRVLVSMQVLNYGAIPVGALLAGTLGSTVGLRPALWILTSGLAMAALTLLFSPLRRHRDLPQNRSALVRQSFPAPHETACRFVGGDSSTPTAPSEFGRPPPGPSR